MLELLQKEQFDAIYRVMEESFPLDEFRPYHEQKALFDDERYSAYGLVTEAGELQGFLTLWQFETFAYVEHFAVAPGFRNGGLGAAILREVTERMSKPICLEVEPPEGELSIRRIGFYRRNGFYLNDYPYIQPPISHGRKAIPLRIMTYAAAVAPETYRNIRDTLYCEVYHCADTALLAESGGETQVFHQKDKKF